MRVNLFLPALVVDDSGTMTSITSRILGTLGFPAVDTAETAQDALDLARERSYGLIISDLHMKPMGGIEFLHHLKADPKTSSVPVIMLSGDPLASAMASVQKAGAAGYVMKAPTPGALREGLEAAIRAAL